MLTFEWIDFFLFMLFHENVFEQKNFIDGIQICLEEINSLFLFSLKKSKIVVYSVLSFCSLVWYDGSRIGLIICKEKR